VGVMAKVYWSPQCLLGRLCCPLARLSKIQSPRKSKTLSEYRWQKKSIVHWILAYIQGFSHTPSHNSLRRRTSISKPSKFKHKPWLTCQVWLVHRGPGAGGQKRRRDGGRVLMKMWTEPHIPYDSLKAGVKNSSPLDQSKPQQREKNPCSR
jgi:hypothetical protein